MSHLWTVLTAHYISSILTHIAVLVPGLLVVILFIVRLGSYLSWVDLFILYGFRLLVITVFVARNFTIFKFSTFSSAWLRTWSRLPSRNSLLCDQSLLVVVTSSFSQSCLGWLSCRGIFWWIIAQIRSICVGLALVIVRFLMTLLLTTLSVIFVFLLFRAFEVLDCLANSRSLPPALGVGQSTHLLYWKVDLVWLYGLLNCLLIFPFHFLGLANAELLTGSLQDLQSNEKRVDVILIQGAFLLEVRLPRLFHVLRWPELEQLEFYPLYTRRLSVLALTRT